MYPACRVFNALLQAPSSTCATLQTNGAGAYDVFTGNSSSFAEVTNASFYPTGSAPKFAWGLQACSSTLPALCQVSAARYTCPPAPPPMPPSPPPAAAGSVCEFHHRKLVRSSLSLCAAEPPLTAAAAPAGLPGNGTTKFCSAAQKACYQLITSPNTYANQKAACAILGGSMVSLNSAAEQREIEDYFVRGSKLLTGEREAPPRCLTSQMLHARN